VFDFTALDILLALCMALGAALFTSVGHGGASVYIALMALFGLAPTVIRPTALALNVLVTSFSSVRYFQAGLFRWRTLWPVLIGAIPMAFLGGSIHLPGNFYKPLVGAVLLIAAARLLMPQELKSTLTPKDIPVGWGIACGLAIGFLAGLTGTGGGIFLSPILLFMGWSETRTASGVTSVFILCNSLAGLAGNYASLGALPAQLWLFVPAVLFGAVIGTRLGISTLAKRGILRALGVVLVIAGLKLIGLY
jgi:uncharacterized protein